MPINELKFESADFSGNDIASLPDRPGDNGMTATVKLFYALDLDN